jgi:hypothetical protein
VNSGPIVAPIMWEVVALNAFAENKSGPAVDALREIIRVMRAGVIYRHTPEFDAICMKGVPK